MKSIVTLTIFALMLVNTSVFAQGGELYTPAYSNPYSNPMSAFGNGTGTNNGNGNGNGNGGNQGNGNGNTGMGGNGVPLDTEAWVLMIAGAAFGACTVLKGRKKAMLKLH
jgi:hypothetical protein